MGGAMQPVERLACVVRAISAQAPNSHRDERRTCARDTARDRAPPSAQETPRVESLGRFEGPSPSASLTRSTSTFGGGSGASDPTHPYTSLNAIATVFGYAVQGPFARLS
jgi:hypothetical protein